MKSRYSALSFTGRALTLESLTMSATKILWGQIAIVVLIVLATTWAALSRYQPLHPVNNPIAVEEGNHRLFGRVLVRTLKQRYCNDHVAAIVKCDGQ